MCLCSVATGNKVDKSQWVHSAIHYSNLPRHGGRDAMIASAERQSHQTGSRSRPPVWYQPVGTGFNWFVPRVNKTAPTTIHVSISHIYNALLNTTVCMLCARTHGVMRC